MNATKRGTKSMTHSQIKDKLQTLKNRLDNNFVRRFVEKKEKEHLFSESISSHLSSSESVSSVSSDDSLSYVA